MGSEVKLRPRVSQSASLSPDCTCPVGNKILPFGRMAFEAFQYDSEVWPDLKIHLISISVQINLIGMQMQKLIGHNTGNFKWNRTIVYKVIVVQNCAFHRHFFCDVLILIGFICFRCLLFWSNLGRYYTFDTIRLHLREYFRDYLFPIELN